MSVVKYPTRDPTLPEGRAGRGSFRSVRRLVIAVSCCCTLQKIVDGHRRTEERLVEDFSLVAMSAHNVKDGLSIPQDATRLFQFGSQRVLRFPRIPPPRGIERANESGSIGLLGSRRGAGMGAGGGRNVGPGGT